MRICIEAIPPTLKTTAVRGMAVGIYLHDATNLAVTRARQAQIPSDGHIDLRKVFQPDSNSLI
jgi:hypothetical protein